MQLFASASTLICNQRSLDSAERELARLSSLTAIRLYKFATFIVTVTIALAWTSEAAALSPSEPQPLSAISTTEPSYAAAPSEVASPLNLVFLSAANDPLLSSNSSPTPEAQQPSTTEARPTPRPVAAPAPQNFFERWQARATRIQSQQPKWTVPVVSAYPMLLQVFRADFTRQISPIHVHTWNLDASRGLNLIPFSRTEFDVLLPPFLEHSDRTLDGFGDRSFQAKYRIVSANEKRGNYLLSSQIVGVVPTGSHGNGATDASLNPTVNGGKGWKRFDVIANLGATLPTGNTATTGRTLTTATVAQYHFGKYLWPELEINTTRWFGSVRDGKIQTFLTPGIVVGKFAFQPHDPKARSGFVAGFAFQTAATTFHTYNHSPVFTSRYIF